MKYFQFFLSAMFFFFASLQFNDPDPLGWIMIYGFAGIVSFLAATGETRSYFFYVLLAGLVVCGIWMASLLPEFIHWINMGTPNIFSSWHEGTSITELVREFMGLGICTLAIAGYLHQFASSIEKQEMRKVFSPEFTGK